MTDEEFYATSLDMAFLAWMDSLDAEKLWREESPQSVVQRRLRREHTEKANAYWERERALGKYNTRAKEVALIWAQRPYTFDNE